VTGLCGLLDLETRRLVSDPAEHWRALVPETPPAPAPEPADLVDPRAVETLDVLGPTIQYLTPPDGDDGHPCVMRGTIPPGVVVPLHSHADPETFVMRSGRVEGLAVSAEGFEWIPVGPGDVFHVPGDAKHAWRNPSREPAEMIIVTTAKLGRFLGEVASAGGPERFLATAERYGYWNATPQENAEVGLQLG
jgi:quercetin dioxygenase-like cupin family protein